MEELLDVYTRDGKYLGVRTRAECHTEKPGFYHKPAWTWVYNSKNEILVQKRALCKKRWAGYWDMACAGHVDAGETPKQGAMREAKELTEKGFLTSSCCPAFVSYIKSEFPDLVEHISHNLSPMGVLAKYLKEKEESAKVVFIGPCTAKKAEALKDDVKPYVDSVLTFEELQALFDSKDIDIMTLEEGVLDNASYFGRIFARSGGLTDAVTQSLKEQNITDFEFNPVSCDGIEECRVALLKKSKNALPANFIEGMACVGGCIGGAGCLTHGDKNKAQVDEYGKEAFEKTILDAVSLLK